MIEWQFSASHYIPECLARRTLHGTVEADTLPEAVTYAYNRHVRKYAEVPVDLRVWRLDTVSCQ